MAVRTRGLDIKAGAAKLKTDRAAAHRTAGNRHLVTGPHMLWSPTIRAALVAGTPWLDVFCPGCGPSRAIDLRTVDRHPLASVGTLVLGLRCSWCQGVAPMPRLSASASLPGQVHQITPAGLSAAASVLAAPVASIANQMGQRTMPATPAAASGGGVHRPCPSPRPGQASGRASEFRNRHKR
jgi:hypothetical protein